MNTESCKQTETKQSLNGESEKQALQNLLLHITLKNNLRLTKEQLELRQQLELGTMNNSHDSSVLVDIKNRMDNIKVFKTGTRHRGSVSRQAKGMVAFYSFPIMVSLAMTVLLLTWLGMVESKALETRAAEEIADGNVESAKQLLAKAMICDRHNPTVYQHCSELSQRDENPEEAIHFVSKALQVMPHDKGLLSKKAELAAELGWHSVSVDTYNKIIASTNSHPTRAQLANRAESLVRLGLYKQALMDYACLAKLSPSSTQAREGMALCYLKSGHPQQSLAQLDKALSLNPDSINGHLLRGNCFKALKQLSSAEQDFNWVLNHDKNNKEANLGLSKVTIMGS